MLMDANLLPLLEKAENGDLRAIFDLSHAYMFGEGVTESSLTARKYLQVLLEDFEMDINEFEYGNLFSGLGHLFLMEKNYKAANENFKKAKAFVWNTYDDEYAQELCNEYELDFWIKETTTD